MKTKGLGSPMTTRQGGQCDKKWWRYFWEGGIGSRKQALDCGSRTRSVLVVGTSIRSSRGASEEILGKKVVNWWRVLK